MVVRASALLAAPRVRAFALVGAVVGVWFVVAPHLPHVGLWPAIAIVSFAVIPAVLLLVLIALPLREERWLFPAAIALALIAFACWKLDWGLAANFAKLWAAVFGGWAFLRLFEQLSWVVLVAVITPLVDILSVWRGPTNHITEHHFEVYTAVAIAFVVPGGGAAYLGPPDILFFALFLAAADRWGLRVVGTWLGCTGMYAFTVVFANAIGADGLPALPFLSIGFLAPNADLIWRALRRPAAAPSSAAD